MPVLIVALASLACMAGCSPASGAPDPGAVADASAQVVVAATFAPLPTIGPSAAPPPTTTVEPTAAPTATPAAPLRLTASYPIDNDGAVLPDRALVLVFDRPVDAASVEAGLAISPTVAGRFEWLDTQRVAFHPEGGWDAAAGSEGWEARLGPGVRAADGGMLEQEVTLHLSLGGRGSPLPVLMYHHVEELGPEASEGKRDWTVSPEAFREQMAYLQQHGFTSISGTALADYLLNGEPLPAKPVVISVDDGNRSFFENGWPIMQETSLRPLMFIVPQFTDYSGYVNWDDLRGLVAGGAWIGSHGYSHRGMGEVPASELAWELGDSRAALESQLGVTVDAFCFPYGGRTTEALAVMAENGYRTGYSLNPIYWQRPEDPYFIGRLRVDYRTTLDEFADLLPG
jgi:peptidoglycan/xylan/chitin deacetylase (PgdA/CDA1 family)